jgi:ligand-binding sensor domain-containing protein
MACKQNTLSPGSFILIVALLIVGATVPAQEQEWTTITSFGHPGEMLILDDQLYLATSGGLMIIDDLNSPGTPYVNTDGLGTSELSDIIRDTEGQIWLTGNGYIIRFDTLNPISYPVIDNEGKLVELTCLVDDGNYLWIGSDRGLILFDKLTDGGQIEDSYGFFGTFQPNPRVNDIMLTEDSIWVATSVGLAVANRSDPTTLKAPSAWTSFTPPEADFKEFLKVVRFESRTYAGTIHGLFELRLPPQTAEPEFVEPPVPQWLSYRDLEIQNDTLWYFFSEARGLYGGYGSMQNDVFTTYEIPGLPHPPTDGIVYNGRVWTSVVFGGIYYAAPGGFVEWPYYGPAANTTTDVVVTADGTIATGFDRQREIGISSTNWQRFDVFGAWTLGGMLDSLQRAWIGTYGGGVYRFDADSVIRYDTTNSSLTGNDQGLNYCVINGMDTDGENLFFACYRSYTDNPIAVVPADMVDIPGAWDAFGINEGITSDRPTGVACYDNLVVMATEADGVYLCDVGSDPFDKSEIECNHLTRENSRLISNTTTSVAFSPDGVLWVGTNRGLSWYDVGIDLFVEIPLPADVGSEVRDMAFDNRGNLWVATPSGVARWDKITGNFETYTAFTSDLVSNDVNGVFYDSPTGRIYFATSHGISIRSSEIGDPVQQIDQVVAFPNPFVITSGEEPLQFNYAFPGTVRIFTPAGEMVDEFPINSRWYGRNKRGEEVASGIYLFVLRDDNGNVARGKFVLVRK